MFDGLKNKAWQFKDQAQTQAQAKYLQKVMEDEGVGYDEAWAICNGKTDPKEPEYTLGFKMADPVVMLAMFGQPSKKKREQARANFRETLDEDERILFDKEVNAAETEKEFKAKYKKAKKGKKVE